MNKTMTYVSLGCNCFWGEVVKVLNDYNNNSKFNSYTNFFSYGRIKKIDDTQYNVKSNISKCDILYDLYTNTLKNNSNDWLDINNIKKCKGVYGMQNLVNFYFNKHKYLCFQRHDFQEVHDETYINVIKKSMQFFNNKADVYIYGGNMALNGKTLELIQYINHLILQINNNAMFFIFSAEFFNKIIAKNIFFIKTDLTNCMFKTGAKPYRLDMNTYLTLCKAFNFKFPTTIFLE